MAFNIELTITGLCALVPSQPIQLGQPGKPGQAGQPPQLISGMTVLVVDARQPRVVPNGDKPPVDLEVCGHLPLFRFPQPEEKKLSGFVVLDGHRITISGVGPGPLVIDPSFKDWIPMELAVSGQPGSARINPKFLDPIPPPGIAGRLELTAGRVSAKSMGTWDFEPPVVPQDPGGLKFASEVQVSIPIALGHAVLTFERNGFASQHEMRPKAGNPSVNLLLSNLCFDDEDHARRPRIEGDFAVFYELLDDYAGILRVPRFLGGPKNQGGGPGTIPGQANVSPACTGTRM